MLMLKQMEISMNSFKQQSQFLAIFQSDLACGLCSDSLAPIDFFLENKYIREALDWVALEVCEHYKIYGGVKSVCKGAIEIMAANLLPSIAEGILSPQRVCDEYLHLCKNPKIIELSADAYV